MSGKGQRCFPCVACKKRTSQKERRKVTGEQRPLLQKQGLTVKDSDVLCNNCRLKIYQKIQKKKNCKSVKNDNACNEILRDVSFSPPQQKTSASVRSPPSVALSLPSTSNSHSSCIICRKPGPKLAVVSQKERFSVFLKKGILIPYGARCCAKHIPNGQFISDALIKMSVFSESSTVNRKTIVDMLMYMRDIALRNENSCIDFDQMMENEQYLTLTGLNKMSFDDLLSHIESNIKNTSVRSTRNSVGIFLFKLRSGLSNSILSAVFNLTKASVRRCITTTRRALMDCFVPNNLGFGHVTRNDIIAKHTRPLAESLFGGTGTQALLVLDGTYIFIQKSTNFAFQRQSYSVHKGRPLVKPMVIVSTTGYYVSVLGPYIAKNNDASILKHIMKTNRENILDWVDDNDVFIVDRGFRDAVEYVEELGLKTAMPAFMKKGESQMTTEAASTSRLVTKIRWVVESANARIKRWKFLDRILPTSQVPYISDFIQIVCSISNKYFPPLWSGNADTDLVIASKMLHLSKQINTLKEEVEARHLDSRSIVMWKKPESMDDLNFPSLSEEEIRNITCGSYQLKLAPSYAEERLVHNSEILVHKEDPSLLRVKIKSRHITSKSYVLWIRFNEGAVTAWYCKCKASARVVGVCAHIAAVIWYLGQQGQSFSAVKNWGEFTDDATQIPDSVDDSDPEDSFVEE